MKCIQCQNEARAICRFCGRAVCESHIQTKEFHAGYGKSKKSHALDRGSETAVTIADAVWCGQCNVDRQKTY